MLDLGTEYDISGKEVEETILRVVLGKLGLTNECNCKPKNIVVRPGARWHKPHCKNCWKFVKVLSKPGGDYEGKFNILTSEFEKDLAAVMPSFTLPKRNQS